VPMDRIQNLRLEETRTWICHERNFIQQSGNDRDQRTRPFALASPV
jgi:hypothetical protein